MEDKQLLADLLAAETEDDAVAALNKRGLLASTARWRILGNLPNNESVVLAQQGNAIAALIEKVTNGIDAILIGHCKAKGINPRDPNAAPKTMAKAVQSAFGDLYEKSRDELRVLAEENLVLYATGTKQRPSLSLYDAGEGQLAKDFPKTFCSVVSSSEDGSYKGAIPFVQGRFNMGGCGALHYCGGSATRRLQLIVSRVPYDVHPWAYTIFCYFPDKQNPCWRYLVGSDGEVLTAGADALGLLPKKNAKSGELCAPRERKVASGTLVKMYDYKAPLSNICGELFKKAGEYLLRPALPLRIIECRDGYKANVMQVTVWDIIGKWSKDKLEPGFEDGASIQIKLSTGEIIPGEIRVFKKTEKGSDDLQTGLRALINGQTHGRRDAQFFKSEAVDKEYVADTMLVTLDCTDLTTQARNQIFKSDRETFRDDGLVPELFRQLRRDLKAHEGLSALNVKRYEEKIAEATSDDDGIDALEDLLAGDPTLAEMFGGMFKGKVAAKTLLMSGQKSVATKNPPFEGKEFPTYFKREGGNTAVKFTLPEGDDFRVSFQTDVKNNYFSRTKHRGVCKFIGQLSPTLHLFNGRLTFTFHADKKFKQGDDLETVALISDNAGHGPFKLTMKITIGAPRVKTTHKKKQKQEEKSQAAPSRPEVKEAPLGPNDPPITVERPPGSKQVYLQVNTGSQFLIDARSKRPPEDARAVDFVFKFGLALIVMGLLDAAKKTPRWNADEAGCRGEIAVIATGVARVIVPLCLSLPQKLPKPQKFAKAA